MKVRITEVTRRTATPLHPPRFSLSRTPLTRFYFLPWQGDFFPSVSK